MLNFAKPLNTASVLLKVHQVKFEYKNYTGRCLGMLKFLCIIYSVCTVLLCLGAEAITTINFNDMNELRTAIFDHYDQTIIIIDDQPSYIENPQDSRTAVYLDAEQGATIIKTIKGASINISNGSITVDTTITKKMPYSPEVLKISNMNGTLSINAGTQTRVIGYTDKDTGEVFNVVPLKNNTKHIEEPIDDTLFEVRKTYNGIVVIPYADKKKNISLSGNEILIHGNYMDYIINHEHNILFPIKNWKLRSGKNFYEKLTLIQKHILSSKLKNLQLFHRLRLAELYLAYNMPNEAAAYLLSIKRITPNFSQYRQETVNKINASLGLALFLSSKYREAADAFEQINPETLANKVQLEELNFWKELTYAKMNIANTNVRFVENENTFLQYYGERKRFNIGMVALELYIKKDELDNAQHTISFLRNDNINTENDALMIVYEARILEKVKNASKKDILNKYEKAISTSEMFSKANVSGRYYRLMFLHKTDSISTERTIAELIRLGREWRGDELEGAILNSLKDLYLKKNQPRMALRSMKDALLYLPNVVNPIKSIAKMTEIFESVFNNTNNISDIELAVIFYDFMELIPIGQRGLDIIIKIADKFQNLGMLSEAIRVTDNAIHMMSGKNEKLTLELLKKLITLNLEKRNSEKALKILDENSEVLKSLPNEMILEFKVEALTQMQKYSDVLDLLGSDNSMYSFHEKSNMYWYTKDWKAIMKQGESILIYRDDPLQKLSMRETIQVQRLSTAYIAHNEGKTFLSLHSAFTNLIQDRYVSAWINLLKMLTNDKKAENINAYISRSAAILKLVNKNVVNNAFQNGIEELSKNLK